MSRTASSIKNIKYAVLGEIIGLLLSFISRMIFVRTLSAEYLGLNGLFGNILQLLSLAELGVGSAIVYSMYKPIADKDQKRLKALMGFYKSTYILIGIIVFILGSILTPFLGVLIKDMPDIPNIKLIYMMYIANTAVSYFFTYKRSLIIADQKKYIDTIYHYGYFIVLNILQIIVLVLTQNFILYLALKFLFTLLENISISKKADELYPYLKDKNTEGLRTDEKNIIAKNVKAMVFHKVGTIVVMGTDNLLISKFIGIVAVGIYSNYLLIINALNQVIGIIFQTITASIGNLGATEKSERSKFIFQCVDLVNFWIYAFASICLLNLFNPFIQLWLGAEYLFPIPLVFIIVINFYLSGMRKSVLTFRDAFGLFWYDRYKPLFESGINLIASILLAQKLGINGILIGTIISTLTTCFWIEPYVLYKHGFYSSVIPYFKKYALHTLSAIIVGYITLFLSNMVSNVSLFGFIGKILICLFVPNFIFLVLFWRTKAFQHLFNIFTQTIKGDKGKL